MKPASDQIPLFETPAINAAGDDAGRQDLPEYELFDWRLRCLVKWIPARRMTPAELDESNLHYRSCKCIWRPIGTVKTYTIKKF